MITNNYRTYERGRRRGGRKRACAVDGRARAARRTSCLSRLSGVSRVCRRQGIVGFDFHQVIIESGEGVVVRDAGHLPARKSPLGHGAAADDAARCVGGLTAIRSASTKAAACPAALQYFNHEFGSSPTRDGRGKRNAGGLRSARVLARRPANRWSCSVWLHR